MLATRTPPATCRHRISRSGSRTRHTEKPPVAAPLRGSMATSGLFGSADSCRKQYGLLQTSTLPALDRHMSHALSGTPEPVTLGRLLVERTNKSLMVLWSIMTAGVPNARIPAHRIPEKIAAAGSGVLGPRELGQLQRILRPASDGTVGIDEWAVAFELTGREPNPVDSSPAAGVSTAFNTEVVAIVPHMRNDAAEAQALMPPPSASTWPGGFVDAHVAQDRQQRLAASAIESSPRQAAPFATVADYKRTLQPPPSPLSALSPTFARHEAPPYATGAWHSAYEAAGRAQAQPAPLAPPYGTEAALLRAQYAADPFPPPPPERVPATPSGGQGGLQATAHETPSGLWPMDPAWGASR